MILAVELGLIFYGIYVLRNARFDCGRDRIVIGPKTRVLGILCLLPLPVSYAICFVIGVVYGLQNKPVPAQSFYAIIELIILVGIVIAIYLLSTRYYKNQQSGQSEQSKVEMNIDKNKSYSPTLAIVVGVTAAIVGTNLAQGKIREFNIPVALLFLVSIGVIIWVFVYSPFGRWLNRWMMSTSLFWPKKRANLDERNLFCRPGKQRSFGAICGRKPCGSGLCYSSAICFGRVLSILFLWPGSF